MQRQKTYNIADSNIANLGTDLEKSVKKAAAEHEPQWAGVGQAEGLTIWRIESFIVTPWPEKQYGSFHSGDSYIVLHTYKKRAEGDALAWDIHFWLGESTSADEAGTAAYKTVELDDILNGAAVQHRECQFYESERFLSYFQNKITYLEGGVDSGFRHVERAEHAVRLLHVKGSKDNIVVRDVDRSAASLNAGDVFILDCGSRIFVWHGSKSNPGEKQKGGELARAMRDGRLNVGGPGQKPPVDVVEQGSEDREFWVALMGEDAVLAAESSVPASDGTTSDGKKTAVDDELSQAVDKVSVSDEDKAAADEHADIDHSQAVDKATVSDEDKAAADEHANIDFSQSADKPASGGKFAAFSVLIKDAAEGGDDASVEQQKVLFRLSDGVPIDVEARMREREAARKKFDPVADAEVLRTALKKFIGKDSASILEVLSNRTRTQLQEVKKSYQQQFGRDILNDLKKKTRAFDESSKVYRALFMTPVEYEAHCCFKATKGSRFATDDATLVEVVCSKTPSELKLLKETYSKLYGKELLTQVREDTNGVFEKAYSALLQALLEGKREAAKADPDMSLVASDANVLYLAGEGKFFGTDKAKFTEVLAHRSFAHLRLVFKAYEKKSKKGLTFEQAVRKAVSGKYRKALLMIIRTAAQDQNALDMYYAERLYRSMKGLGTRDSVLVRELITVIDAGRLDAVKKLFYEAYASTLSSWVTGDTSGDYRKLLLGMIGEDVPELYGGSSMSFEKVASGKVSRSMLDSSDAFIFDTGFQVFVWIGKEASAREKKHGLHYGQIYLNDAGKPPHTPISRILEGGENEVFEASFDA